MKDFIKNHIKNLGGWTTNRKILCFAVDDYGNVMLNNRKSLEILESKGVSLRNRFDRLDALDTTEDYEMLFDVLSKNKDKNNKYPVFTTYALPANINFEKVLKNKDNYEYELLPETYSKLSAYDSDYEGTFQLLTKGIEEGFIRPQFHGREHLSVDLFNYLLDKRDPVLMENLKQRSYVGIPKNPQKPTITYNTAFSFWNVKETESHLKIIKDGLRCFEKVYGYKSTTFTPPALQFYSDLIPRLNVLGIKSVDKYRDFKHHVGSGKFKRLKHKTQVAKGDNHVSIVRNSVFEPNINRNISWADYTLKQVEAAFRLKKPAIVSSHRVNFCGKISPTNRNQNLQVLGELISKICTKFPEVEFFSIDELVEEIIINQR